MPRHPDAIGYLNDLAAEARAPWFKMICDLAAIGGVSTLDRPTTNALVAVFMGNASYVGIRTGTAYAVPRVPASAVDFLENLSGFGNFKLLQDTLNISFAKRIALVFGTNGSGKSSLCESLKVLASPEQPSRPLKNVRTASAATTQFIYKFRSDTTPQTWTPGSGYGPRQSFVKYFDTGIAVKNVKDSVEPGRVIVLTPFKLHVFEWAQSLTTQLRDVLQRARLANASKLATGLEEIRGKFIKFDGRNLASIDERTLINLATEIKIGEAFTDQELLRTKQSLAVELTRATSEEGLKLLNAEKRELNAFLLSINAILNSSSELWSLKAIEKTKTLGEKQTAQELVAKELIPNNATLEQLRVLLNAASSLCNFDDAKHEECPLCRRELTGKEVHLFSKYHALIAGQLEEEINSIRADLNKAAQLIDTIGAIDRREWQQSLTLSKEVLGKAMECSDAILANCNLTREANPEAQDSHASLRSLYEAGIKLESEKSIAIEAAEKGRDKVVEQLAKVEVEIQTLEYAKCILDNIALLKDAQELANEVNFWDVNLPLFPPLLKKLTDASKAAHDELVVTDFETRLNGEYLALTNKPMSAFGVKLARRGSDALVTVLPQIGGNEIDWVLSEGEKRVHALALFFAELDSCSHSIIIFDDPVSSFDYDYIANYCRRVRDFILMHLDRQIIVLTHNWEFFVQLQLTFNAAALTDQCTVQIIENCSVIADYSEKIDDLKRDIRAILAVAGEPSKGQKEEMAGKLRRLIESVVNTLVFNKQRHQYKQKSSIVSDFQQFTKLVPLQPGEATTLRDLYTDLSITEHDDPRNAYVNTDKATFRARLDRILAIEAALESRR